jgi:mxaD protein
MTKISFIGFLILACPALLVAHGPTPQKAKENISINAPVDKVWDVVKDFGGISKWHGDVKDSKGDGKHESGGLRTLTFQNGEEIVDELDYYSDKDHEYSYRLKKENVKALPTSSYSVTVSVTLGASPEASEVTIKSRF